MRARPFARKDRVTAGDTTVIDRYGGTPINGNPRLRKLLEDNGKGVVYEYYQKTGFFHANHNVIVQNRILRDHPWVALELFNAFQRSKEVAYERARRSQSAYLYFPGKDFQEQAAVLGEDPYPIGLRATPSARVTASPLAILRSLTGMVVRLSMAMRACGSCWKTTAGE